MIAMMLNMCALEARTTIDWYCETNAVDDVQYLIDRFLSAAITVTPSKEVGTTIFREE